MYIPSQMDWKAETMANIMAKTLLWKHDSLEVFILDKGSLFIAHYWEMFCAYLTIHCWYSTAFHPQTDGQTEQKDQTLEQHFQSYINYQQDDWVIWLPIAEFVYNNRSKYYDKKYISWIFNIGNKVWLNGKNIKTVQPSKRLDYKYFEPFMIFKPIRKQAYQLDLPKTFWKVYNVFHVNFFKLYRTFLEQEKTKLLSTEMNSKKHWKIKKVFDSWIYYEKL